MTIEFLTIILQNTGPKSKLIPLVTAKCAHSRCSHLLLFYINTYLRAFMFISETDFRIPVLPRAFTRASLGTFARPSHLAGEEEFFIGALSLVYTSCETSLQSPGRASTHLVLILRVRGPATRGKQYPVVFKVPGFLAQHLFKLLAAQFHSGIVKEFFFLTRRSVRC